MIFEKDRLVYWPDADASSRSLSNEKNHFITIIIIFFQNDNDSLKHMYSLSTITAYAHVSMQKTATLYAITAHLFCWVLLIMQVSACIEHACTCSTVQGENTDRPHVLVSENQFGNK